MQDTAFTVWQNISGSGMLAALYVCAVVFLFFWEKETYKRILFVIFPAFWIGVLMLPITYKVVAEVIDVEVYYRFFWMLPMTLVIAYTFVQVYHLYCGKYKRLTAVCLVLVLVCSGDFVYNNWRYSKAENKFHVSDTIVEICDLMHVDGREVMALFPMELMQYVRQYDSTICMPYGRNVLVDDWNINHPLYNMMEEGVLDCEELAEAAALYECSYVVFSTAREKKGEMTTGGYVLKDTVGGYQIYYNDEIFQSIYK